MQNRLQTRRAQGLCCWPPENLAAAFAIVTDNDSGDRDRLKNICNDHRFLWSCHTVATVLEMLNQCNRWSIQKVHWCLGTLNKVSEMLVVDLGRHQEENTDTFNYDLSALAQTSDIFCTFSQELSLASISSGCRCLLLTPLMIVLSSLTLSRTSNYWKSNQETLYEGQAIDKVQSPLQSLASSHVSCKSTISLTRQLW